METTPISTVATTTSILSNTLNSLNAVRERVQTSKDRDLMENISTLYDCVLSLKESAMLLTDENKELKRRIAELEHPAEKPTPEVGQVGTVNDYFAGDKPSRSTGAIRRWERSSTALQICSWTLSRGWFWASSPSPLS